MYYTKFEESSIYINDVQIVRTTDQLRAINSQCPVDFNPLTDKQHSITAKNNKFAILR